MKKIEKYIAALMAVILMASNVGVIPAAAEEGATTSDEYKSIYQEDFNGDEQLVYNGTNGYANLSATGEIYDGVYNSAYAAGVGDPYGKTEDGALYLRGSGISSTTGSKAVNNQLWFNFTNDKTYTNEKVYIQVSVKNLTTYAPYQFMIVANSQTLATMKTGKILNGSGPSIISSTNYTTFHIEIDFVEGVGTYSIYLDDNKTLVASGSYGKNTLTSLAFRMTGQPYDLRSEEYGGNAGICIDNIAIYESFTRYKDIFAEPTGISIDNQTVLLGLGNTEQLKATVETAGIAPAITWTSSDENIATVSSSGLVTAVSPGTALITAQAGDVTGTCTVIVQDINVIYKEDFEGIASFNQLGFSSGGVEGYEPEIRYRDCNQYLFLETGLTTENYVTIPFENTYENTTVWVEMDIYSDEYFQPRRFQIKANDVSNMSDSSVEVAYKNTSMRNPGADRAHVCSLLTDVWVRLSYKIDLSSHTITAYMDGTLLYECPYRENWLPTCSYLRLSIPVNQTDEGQMVDMGFCIDNLAVYVSEEQTDVFPPEIKGTNLSLEGNIGINYHTDLRGIWGTKKSDAYMQFSLPNGTDSTVKVSDAMLDSTTGFYIFPAKVAAKEMTGTITAQMFDGNGVALTGVKEYTVYDNATYIVSNASSNTAYEVAMPLAKTLLNYGGYAQEYFGYNVGDLANKDLSADDKNVSDVSADTLIGFTKMSQSPNESIGAFYGASLSLKSETALNFYFKLADGVDMNDVSFTCGEETLVPVQSGDMYCVKVDDIGSIDLDTVYTVTVSKGEETLLAYYSALGYAYSVLRISDDNTSYKNLPALKNVVRALYKYNQEAEKYKTGVLKLFYYNDFEDAERNLGYASVSGNVIHVMNDDNSYVKLDFNTVNKNYYYQESFSGIGKEDALVIEMKLSTEGTTPDTSLQYKYTRAGSNNMNNLFQITGNKMMVGETEVASITAGPWTKIGVKLDGKTGVYTIYVYDEANGIYERKVTSTVNPTVTSPSYVRFYVNSSDEAGTLLVDDIAIYEGADFIDMSEGEPLTALEPTTAEDVEIVYNGDSNYATTPVFSQDMIDAAITYTPGGWTADEGNSDQAEKTAQALYYLLLVSRFDSSAAHSTTGVTCVQAAKEKIEFFVAGGNEPFACVGPYWGHAVLAADFALAKNTDVVYNELSDDTRARMDCIMEALAITGNWGYNDANDYKTGIDLLGNFGKNSNPNYNNTYLSVVMSASMYFGAEELDNIFTDFSYDTYMAQFEEYGFTNIYNKWSSIGYDKAKDLMENGGDAVLVGSLSVTDQAGDAAGTGQGVKVKFSYNGHGASELTYLFSSLCEWTYAWAVTNDYGTPGGADYSYILSGKDSPFLGQMGMMREFASTDSGGIRSDLVYCYDSWAILVPVYTNMKLLGGWDSSTSDMKKMDRRIYVGNEDLLFKMQEGYHSYSIGRSHEKRNFGVLRGHMFVEEIWETFHCSQIEW